MDSPKTLIDFMEMFKTEEDCRQALFEHRWPAGFRCPRCGCEQAYSLKTRPLYECISCGHQASVTAGTLLEGTRTDLRKWFLAIYLLASTKKPLSSAELGRQLSHRYCNRLDDQAQDHARHEQKGGGADASGRGRDG